jgi:hypothetical protein
MSDGFRDGFTSRWVKLQYFNLSRDSFGIGTKVQRKNDNKKCLCNYLAPLHHYFWKYELSYISISMKCDILTLETKDHLFIGKRLQLLNKNATITNLIVVVASKYINVQNKSYKMMGQ